MERFVCVLTIDENNPHSPLYQDRLCIDGCTFRGVFDYMMQSQHHLLEAMMAKYTQHIYLQKVFHGENPVRLTHVRVNGAPPWMAHIDETYEHCRTQFRPVTDMEELLRLLPKQDGDAHADWLARATYFALAQPACGRDRAVYLSRLWMDKRVHKKRYEPLVEDEIALYAVSSAFV